MRQILIATKNPGKFKEIVECLDGASFEFLSLKDFDIDDAGFVEDGETFEENARKKARFYFEKTGLMTLGEDSGIMVDALAGELGVKTRRWGAGENASDEEWMDVFMKRMNGETNRAAEFVCFACLMGAGDGDARRGCGESGDECLRGGGGRVRSLRDGIIFEGQTRGTIAEKILAPLMHGIPLSSVFVPDGFSHSYAELGVAEKNKISHRGKAMRGVRGFLEKMLGNL